MPKTLAQKREEAEERQAAHAKRTVEQQLALIEQRPGNSARERERLVADVLPRKPKKNAKKKGVAA